MNNLTKETVYLVFQVQNEFHVNIGEVKILINKKDEIEKWKEPSLCGQQAVEIFKEEFVQYKSSKLNAFHIGDILTKN